MGPPDYKDENTKTLFNSRCYYWHEESSSYSSYYKTQNGTGAIYELQYFTFILYVFLLFIFTVTTGD